MPDKNFMYRINEIGCERKKKRAGIVLMRCVRCTIAKFEISDEKQLFGNGHSRRLPGPLSPFLAVLPEKESWLARKHPKNAQTSV